VESSFIVNFDLNPIFARWIAKPSFMQSKQKKVNQDFNQINQ